MTNITIERQGINDEALDAELRAALGNLVTGISSGPYGVIVHLDDQVTSAETNQARRMVENHDPEVLTPRQQAAQQRQQKLVQMRGARTEDLDPADYSGETPSIQALAERIAWLEQEILDLRGGS